MPFTGDSAGLADAMMSDSPEKKWVSGCDMFGCYVMGIASQAAQGAGATTVSEVLTKVQRRGSARSSSSKIMIRDAIEGRSFRNDVPVELISKSLAAW